MVHRQWSLADVRRIRLRDWKIISMYFAYATLMGGGGGGTQVCIQGGNSGKINSWALLIIFVREVALLGVSYH